MWGIGYGFALFVYAIGSDVCHQRPERSFHLLGVQLPVCARCTGIYAGAALASIVAMAFTPYAGRIFSPRSARTALIVSALPTMVTLAYEWTTGDTPGNWARAASGVPLGACVAWIVLALVGTDTAGRAASRRSRPGGDAVVH